jgi:hypothetical protein
MGGCGGSEGLLLWLGGERIDPSTKGTARGTLEKEGKKPKGDGPRIEERESMNDVVPPQVKRLHQTSIAGGGGTIGV